jgi:regulator of nonsense transcripts 1
MSQESMGFTYDDYKSEDTQSMLSQDFDLRSQASQSFTQY